MKTLIKLTQWKKARLALSAVTVTALCVFGVFLYDTADYRTAMGRAYGDEAAVRAITSNLSSDLELTGRCRNDEFIDSNFRPTPLARDCVFGVMPKIATWVGAIGIANISGVRDVSIGEAKALIDAGAIVIDVRSGDAYDHRHLPGALYILVEKLESSIPASIAGAKDKPVVVYCSEGTNRGPIGTAVLNKSGFTQAVNLTGGIQGWAAAKQPIISKG